MQDRIPHIPRIRRTATAFVFLMVGGSTAASSQEVDQGTLLIMRGADTLGIEQYLVRESPTGLEVSTTVSYPRRRPRVTIDGVLRTTSAGIADFTSIENGIGPVRRVISQFSPDRTVIRRFSERGEAAHEFPPRGTPLVAFDSLFGFFAVLPAEGPVTVTNPQRDRFEAGTLSDLGQAVTTVNGRRQTLRHLSIVTPRGTIDLWFEDRKLQKVEDQTTGWVAERIPAPRR